MQKSDSPININQPKPGRTWTAKQAVLVSVLAYFIAQFFVAIPIIIYGIAAGQDALDDEFLGKSWVSLMLTGVSAMGLITTLFVFLKLKKISIKKLGFKKLKAKIFGYVPLAYLVYVFALALAVGLVSSVVPEFNPDQVQDVGFDDAVGWQLGLAFIGLVVIAPIAEEMLFRGFLYKGLKHSGNNRLILAFGLVIASLVTLAAGTLAGLVVALLTITSAFFINKNRKLGAAIFSSMLFGLVHLQWNVAVDTFILSFALVWVLEKTGNLWAPIFLHALKNFVAFIFVFGIVSIPGA